MKNTLKLAVPFLTLLMLSACDGRQDRPNIEPVQDMFDAPTIKPQEGDADSPGGSGMRVPPEGTVPVGFVPYKYATDPAGAARELRNPMTDQDDQAQMMVGIKMYETQCTVCHGSKGEGGPAANSVVSAAMALKPPSLLTEKVRAMNDGQLYHIITVGQGVMGPYAAHVPQGSRWQLVNYIRQLQKNAGK